MALLKSKHLDPNFTGSFTISGSLQVDGELSGSALSTGSFGQIKIGGGTFTSESLASAGSGAGFPFSGSAIITGSLIVSQSNVDFSTSTGVTGSSFTGSFVGDGSGLTNISTGTQGTQGIQGLNGTQGTLEDFFT